MKAREFKKLEKSVEAVNDLWCFVYDLRSSGIQKVEYDYEGQHFLITSSEVLLALNIVYIFLSELKLQESERQNKELLCQ